MGKGTLIRNIKNFYEQKDYTKALENLEICLNIKGFKLSADLLDIYINCQINLGLLQNADKNVQIMRKKFFKFYTLDDLAIKHMKCGNMDKFNEIITSEKLIPTSYYYIAKQCFLWEHYEEAQKLFTHFIEISTSPYKTKSAKEYLRKIKL